VAISIRTSKKGTKTFLFFIAVTPPCNRFGGEIVTYETFSTEGIASLGTMFPDPLTTSFSGTSLSLEKV
jgi:hypothetical protein